MQPAILIARQDEELQNLKKYLSVVEQRARDWENRYRQIKRVHASTPNAIRPQLSDEALATLTREAIMRGLQIDTLAKRLIETVARDKLFTAVLDQ